MDFLDDIIFFIRSKVKEETYLTVIGILFAIAVAVFAVAYIINDINKDIVVLEYNKIRRYDKVINNGIEKYVGFNLPKGKYRIINIDDAELFLYIESDDIYSSATINQQDGYEEYIVTPEDRRYVIDEINLFKKNEKKYVNIPSNAHLVFVKGDRVKLVYLN